MFEFGPLTAQFNVIESVVILVAVKEVTVGFVGQSLIVVDEPGLKSPLLGLEAPPLHCQITLVPFS